VYSKPSQVLVLPSVWAVLTLSRGGALLGPPCPTPSLCPNQDHKGRLGFPYCTHILLNVGVLFCARMSRTSSASRRTCLSRGPGSWSVRSPRKCTVGHRLHFPAFAAKNSCWAVLRAQPFTMETYLEAYFISSRVCNSRLFECSLSSVTESSPRVGVTAALHGAVASVEYGPSVYAAVSGIGETRIDCHAPYGIAGILIDRSGRPTSGFWSCLEKRIASRRPKPWR
jgi:hypothetical protein